MSFLFFWLFFHVGMLNLQSRVSSTQTRWGVPFPAGVTSWYGWQPPLHTHSFLLFWDNPPRHCWIPVAPSLQAGMSHSTFLAAVMENKKTLFKGWNVHHFCSRSNFFNSNFSTLRVSSEAGFLTLENADFIESLLSPSQWFYTPHPPLNSSLPLLSKCEGGMWSHGRKETTSASSETSFLSHILYLPDPNTFLTHTDSADAAIHGTQLLIYKMFNN